MAKEFAIIETGGKQYMVSAGDIIRIEKLKTKGDPSRQGAAEAGHKVGDSVVFDNVLMVDNGFDTTIGEPFIKGAQVTGEIKKIARAKKVVVIKYKAKSNYFKKRGHRQPYFKIKITKLG
ncbi:MAG: 50S ribosomal protein L21 [Patescibacteria group bacterium]|nr:50S ribosomal protein L21 [Patescibacteria group bacterium]